MGGSLARPRRVSVHGLRLAVQFGAGQGSTGFGTMHAVSGGVSRQVDMAGSSANNVDRTFAFMISGGTQ